MPVMTDFQQKRLSWKHHKTYILLSISAFIIKLSKYSKLNYLSSRKRYEHKMKSKAIALLLVTGMLLAGFTGCSGTKAADTETRTFMGQVTAIDNNTITLALGEQARSSDGTKQNANANATSASSTGSDTQPSAPPDGTGNGGPNGQSGNGGTPPARPDGKTSGSAMGTAPQGGGQAPSSTNGQAPSSADGQTPKCRRTGSCCRQHA